MEPLISVIVPVYQAERYLNQCIESILAQTYKNIELILVDDGSMDNSSSICELWAKKDSRITLVHQRNAGVSAARNKGIIHSKGDFILFVDSDDYIHENMISCMNEHRSNGCTVAVSYDRDNNLLKTDEPIKVVNYRKLIKCRGGSYVWGILYDAGIIKKYGLLFDENLKNLEDVVWNSLYYLFQPRISYIPSKLYNYRNTPNSITSKCCDSAWQIESWIKAYFSVLGHVEELELDRHQKKMFNEMIRSYINNIHAELYF